MATTLSNQALISYYYNEEQGGGSASSNVATTTLLDAYSLTASKTAQTATFRPGQRVTYNLLVTNNGVGPLYNIVVTDDLGGPSSMTYLNGSMLAFLNGAPVTVTPTVSGNSLTVAVPGPLATGATLVLSYVTVVNPALTATTITNTACVTAMGGSSTGGCEVTSSPCPTATVTAETFAELVIYKQGAPETVSPGDALTYTFFLSNTGNADATNVVMTDALPTGFTPSEITVMTGGVTTTYGPGDYTVDPATNVLTLPSAEGPEITVPSAVNGDPGTATITISGTVSGSVVCEPVTP
ncbi:MAG: DUF11 domain-containing protein [Clostridia bacterium]|nr:DUF11 domain-containing protein [Clostridia bacterium]